LAAVAALARAGVPVDRIPMAAVLEGLSSSEMRVLLAQVFIYPQAKLMSAPTQTHEGSACS